MTDQLADPRVRCCVEVAEHRACWTSVPLNSRRPICAGHADDPYARVSLRLARWTRAERQYRAERWRGESDVP